MTGIARFSRNRGGTAARGGLMTALVAMALVAGLPGWTGVAGAADRAVFSIADATVVEGDAGTVDVSFSVTRTGGTARSNAIRFATSGGTASTGVDFVTASGTVEFAKDVTNQVIVVTVLNDSLHEGDEGFSVTLSHPRGATIGDAVGVGTIVDDDVTADLVATLGLSVRYLNSSGMEVPRSMRLGGRQSNYAVPSNPGQHDVTRIDIDYAATLTNDGPDAVANATFTVFNNGYPSRNPTWVVSGTFTGMTGCGGAWNHPSAPDKWAMQCTGVDLPVGAVIQVDVQADARDLIIGAEGADDVVSDPDTTDNVVNEPMVDLEATAVSLGSGPSVAMTGRASNLGPEATSTAWVHISIVADTEKYEGGLSASGTFTGGTCVSFDSDQAHVSWTGSCGNVGLIDDAYLSIDASASHDTTPFVTATAFAYDDLHFDPDLTNNIDTDSWNG